MQCHNRGRIDFLTVPGNTSTTKSAVYQWRGSPLPPPTSTTARPRTTPVRLSTSPKSVARFVFVPLSELDSFLHAVPLTRSSTPRSVWVSHYVSVGSRKVHNDHRVSWPPWLYNYSVLLCVRGSAYTCTPSHPPIRPTPIHVYHEDTVLLYKVQLFYPKFYKFSKKYIILKDL